MQELSVYMSELLQDGERCTRNGEAPLDVSGASPYALVCRSACVLQAGSDAGDGAQDEVDESGLLAMRVLLQFFLRADRRLPEHR